MNGILDLELKQKINSTIRSCAVAKSPAQARVVLDEFFSSTATQFDDATIIKALFTELCVCVFHGFSTLSADDGNEAPEVKQHTGSVAPQDKLPPSALGTIPPPAAQPEDKAHDGYKYDEYSDDSHGYTSYSDSEQQGSQSSNDSPSPMRSATTEDKWARALSEDMHRIHHSDPTVNGEKVTCDDLFQALVSNVSSVVLPKVPSASSSTASVVSSASSLPSNLPTQSSSLVSSQKSSPGPDLDPDGSDAYDLEPSDLDDLEENSLGDEVEAKKKGLNSLLSAGSSVSTVDMVQGFNATSSPLKVDAVDPNEFSLRRLLENAVAHVLQQVEFESCRTPEKTRFGRNEDNDTGSKQLSLSLLKRVCRAVSIELSLELRSPSINSSFPGSNISSPVARDIDQHIWPVLSSFVGAEQTDDMVAVLVDMLEAQILDSHLYPISSIEEEDEGEMRRSVSDGSAVVPGSAQSDLVDRYVKEITLREEEMAEVERLHRDSDKSNEDEEVRQSTSRQVLAMETESDVEDLRQVQSPYPGSTMATVGSDTCSEEFPGPCSYEKKHERSNDAGVDAWDLPKSPMDDVFRRTVGALGSPYKMPNMTHLSDMNDSTSISTGVQSSGEVSSDSNCDKRSDSCSSSSSDDESEGFQADDEEEGRHEDTEYVESVEEAELRSVCDEDSSAPGEVRFQPASVATSAAVAGSDVYSSCSSQSPSQSPHFDLGRDDGSAPPSPATEDIIRAEDLPDDFGSTLLNGQYVSITHKDSGGIDVDSLEDQMESISPGSGSRMLSAQPSIDEILVAELENLIVLPAGESPLSSPDISAKNRFSSSPGNKESSLEGKKKGSPKYRDRDPCTSSEEDNDDGNSGNGSAEGEDDATQQQSLMTDAAVAPSLCDVMDALSRESSDESDNEETETALRGTLHIPPSPYLAEGFQEQIPYPRDIGKVADQVTSPSEGDNCGRSDGKKGPSMRVEMYSNRMAVNIPQPGRSGVDRSPNIRYTQSYTEDSSDSSDEYLDHVIPPSPSMDIDDEPPDEPEVNISALTSDDERDEDRRLFDAIMASAPPSAVEDTESDAAFMSHLMRSTMQTHVIGDNGVNFLTTEENLFDMSNAAAERMAGRLDEVLKDHSGVVKAFSPENREKNDGHSDIQFDENGLAVSGDDLTPSDFDVEDSPEYLEKALLDTDIDYSQLPITSSGHLNKEFLQSFRELMAQYTEAGHDSSNGAGSPKKSPKKSTGAIARSTSPGSKRRSRENDRINTRRSKDIPSSGGRTSPSKSSASTNKAEKHRGRGSKSGEKEKDSKQRPNSLTGDSSRSDASNPVDSSKHVIAGGSTVIQGGKVVYAEVTDAPALAKEWNASGRYQSHKTRCGSAPTRMRVKYTSNSATAAMIAERARKEPRRKKSSSGKRDGKLVSSSLVLDSKPRRSQSAGRMNKSMTDVDLSASTGSGSSTKRKGKKVTRSESDRRLKHLAAPTFSSAARMLDIAGLHIGDLAAMAQSYTE
mmetsp:Transcript_24345/g.35702  ORF Transcript_24345/g.35702 Transcript_24345/m.35702 type:complete len:1489 (-) Transcript_24345:207-4673(-)|eukprot:CAMPEP_0185034744 /NCGR_PEP_ID=MMETSP1103-20130426/24885_1 /TAXON_ID=36769 /ORGANISM="Paraphysomonas bandaiensis, Strain Caron Lab Isolate" /LENGTH=1488 /DNA_ID=CAMNT_0027571525 /DNA_START=99 /DNA_END=4565 /DNA_ORIENTATION=-